VFNFDDNCTLSDKLVTIEILIAAEFTWVNIIEDISWALGITLISYMVIVLTRTLSLFIEFKVMPWITGKIVSKNVVLKSVYDEVVSERDEYSEKYEEQRKNVRLLSKNFDEQVEQIKEKDTDIIDKTNKVSKLNQNIEAERQKLQNSESELQSFKAKGAQLQASLDITQQNLDNSLADLKQFGTLFFEGDNKLFWDSIDRFPPIVLNKVSELKSMGKWTTFLSVGKFIESGGSIDGAALTEMAEFGLVSEKYSRERLTALGEIIWNFRSKFDTYDLPF
jgi:hypothetical protein